MRYVIRKKTLNLISISFIFILLLFFMMTYFNLRENFYKEYIRHKEIMFVLKNYKTKAKAEINEEFIRNIILNNFAEFKSFAQIEGNYEIKGKNLHGIRIPQLLFSIEDSGLEILKFKAVDNTGKGIYDFEIIVK